MAETRLERLKKERDIVTNLTCLSFDLIEQCQAYFDHEIECIVKYGSANPIYEDDK